MGSFEIIAGIGEPDKSYAFLATRPPLEEAATEAIIQAITKGEINIEQTSIVDDTSEIELRRRGDFSPHMVIVRANIAQNELSRLGHEVTVRSKCVLVTGPDNLFDQYNRQYSRGKAS